MDNEFTIRVDPTQRLLVIYSSGGENNQPITQKYLHFGYQPDSIPHFLGDLDNLTLDLFKNFPDLLEHLENPSENDIKKEIDTLLEQLHAIKSKY